ncbi:glycosyltransferase family 4 protein [Candidatus Cloacimonadota bacterium]
MYKILHVLAQRPGRTGSGVFLNALVEQAARKGHQQAVIAGIPFDDKLDFPQIKLEFLYPVYFDTPDLPFHVAGMSDVMPYPSTTYSKMSTDMLTRWNESFEKAIKQALYQFKPDIIISHHLWMLTALVKKLVANNPVIAISHGTGLRQLNLASHLKENVIKGCRDVDLVLALNIYQRNEIVRQYGIKPENIVVTGCGYNSDIFYPPADKTSSDKIKLVYCGKLSKAKGVIHLIKIFNQISRGKNLELIMIGSGHGSEETKIRQLAAENPDKINFRGSVDQQEVGDIFREADIFILPSFYEGFGLVVLEALATGLKVITTEIPGLRSWLGSKINNSGQINYIALPRLENMDQPLEEDIPQFEKDLKQTLLKVIDSLDNKYDISCLKEIEEKSWENLFQNIENLINDLKGC